MIRKSPVAALALMVAGCALERPPISNPNSLPTEALTLQYLVSRGCLPYALGQKTEEQAMRGIGLNHIRPLLGLEPGDTAPFWTGFYPGGPRINVGRGVCNTIVHGSNVIAYRTAAEIALRQGFGGGPSDDGRTEYTAWLPDQISGCRQGVRYTYYQPPGRSWFQVDLSRVADCLHDPMRGSR